MRHQGVMESEILYLLGVKPVWDTKGRVKDVELITNPWKATHRCYNHNLWPLQGPSHGPY
ncbi:MAG TPA: hypothetical protein GXX32_02330 [Methanothermobacter sp.]|nr:hypothetical protein [Methanothermobacter sp.]